MRVDCCLQFRRSQRTKKEFKLHTVYAVISVAIKPLVRWQNSSLSPSSSPCLSSGKNSLRLFQVIEGYDSKIDGQALRAAHRHSLGGCDRQAQTQGVSESAAVAVGSDRLA